MTTPTRSGWYAATPPKAGRGHVVLATLGADGYMLARVEGEPGGPRVLSDARFAGLEFHGPFASPEGALERLLEGPNGSLAAAS